MINLCPGQIGIIARTCKQPRCPSTDEWIRKLWYICTMEYYSAIKKNTDSKKIRDEVRSLKRALQREKRRGLVT